MSESPSKIETMKKLFFGTMLMLALTLSAIAQPGKLGPRAQEKIEAYKIAFFTERLQLTPEESKDFWPLFNQFETERDALRDKYNLESKKVELMSDKEVENFVMQHIELEEEQVKLRRNYVRRFMEVLPIRKVALLQRVDRDFKQHLLDEMIRRKEARQGGRRN
jgi:hypothetical protein